MKPARCRARARRRLYLLFGIEVRPSRARLAFWRCEQALAMLWMPIFFFIFFGATVHPGLEDGDGGGIRDWEIAVGGGFVVMDGSN